jgi:6,7-dimethyl-8-ribityllumazine synthase
MLAMDSGIPVIFGVLTVDDTEQAMDRAGDEESNKGYEAALAALEMVSVIRQIKS